MKKLVISLLRRSDRKAEWQKNDLLDFEYVQAIDGESQIFRKIKGRKHWRDAFRNRKLLQNEVACFLSHIKAWERCIELNKPVIVMEDDAIVNELWDESKYEQYIKHFDFIYLQRNENEPEAVVSINDDLEKPYYPYNMTAYALTPFMAGCLLSKVNYHDFIPVDEFMPEFIRMIDQFDWETKPKIVALKKDACNQLSRDMTDIENSRPFRNYKIHAITCGTDRKKCTKLFTSARHHGVDIVNIGNNIEWKGTDMSSMGGGMKINLMKEYLKDVDDEDVVLFTDAYDVFYADDIETIHERFLDMQADCVFSAEAVCWPSEELAPNFPEAEYKSPYKYLNSGTYIGKARTLKGIMNHDTIADDGDDQLYIQKVFLEAIYDIKLDYECYIFQTHDVAITKLGNQLSNKKMHTCPCIYHGNGGDEAKRKFDSLYREFYPQTSAMFIPNYNKIQYLANDMLLVDFMTQEQCERMIEIADIHGGWGSLSYDKFPAQEIRLKELGLWEELDKYWQEYIVPLTEKYWKPLQMYGLRDGFVMRYALDTQVNLNLHHDASLVTGSVKLNDDYVGAELIYPRQGISNVDIPVGKMILFPGQLTHGHECLPLKQGIKYSLTIWTCRYVGDTI